VRKMPLSEIKADNKNDLIKKIIEHEISQGKSQKEAVAIAMAEAKRRGYDIDLKELIKSSLDSFNADAGYTPVVFQQMIPTPFVGKAQELNGVIKVPITIAMEMVQNYHRKEVPWLADKLPADISYIKVFKPWGELKKNIGEIKELPFVMPHTEATFSEDTCPADLKKYMKDFIRPDQIMGYVRDLYADDYTHKIKGNLYLPTKKHDPAFIQAVKDGQRFHVSIGFMCDWAEGGKFNGEEYLLTQKGIRYGHVAGLLHAQGKCPIGRCGINQDQNLAVDNITNTLNIHHDMNQVIGLDFDGHVHTIQTFISNTASDSTNPQPSQEKLVQNEGFKYPILHNENNALLLKQHEVNKKMPTIEELQAALAAKDTEILQLKRASADSRVAELEKGNKDLSVERDTMKAMIASKDSEIATLKQKCADLDADNKKFKDEEAKELKAFIKKRTEKIGDKKVDDMCLDALRIAKNTIVQLADSSIQENGIPKPAEDARVENTEQSGKKKMPMGFVNMADHYKDK